MEQIYRIAVKDNSNGNKAAVSAAGLRFLSGWFTAVGGTSASVKLQITNDPTGVSGWVDAAQRVQGGTSYATTARTVTPSAPVSLFMDPADMPAFVRVVVSSQTGPTDLRGWIIGYR